MREKVFRQNSHFIKHPWLNINSTKENKHAVALILMWLCWILPCLFLLNCNEPYNLWKLTWEKQQIMSDGWVQEQLFLQVQNGGSEHNGPMSLLPCFCCGWHSVSLCLIPTVSISIISWLHEHLSKQYAEAKDLLSRFSFKSWGWLGVDGGCQWFLKEQNQ